MDYTELRKKSLKSFIGFLGLTALIAIFSVLNGEFGALQVKILATCFTISAASICAMSCAAFIEKKNRAELGLAGIGLCLVAATLIIIGIWLALDNDVYWKTTLTFTIFAIAFAHAFLLALPELDSRQQWIQVASSASIAVLAILIIVAVWAEIDAEGYFRLVAVVSIIVGLETLVIPILMKLRKGNRPERKSLVLEHIEGERYRDAAGKVYHVHEVNAEHDRVAVTDEALP